MKINFFKIASLSFLMFCSISCTNEENKTSIEENKNIEELASRPITPIMVDEVRIGTQIWKTKNLNVSRYRNGDLIPQVSNPTQWTNLSTGAWCYNTNNLVNGRTYGKLYNWYAVSDPRGLAPEGYHIPSAEEWNVIIAFLGGINVSAGKMKATSLWLPPNTGATNSSGFTGLPGGYRFANGNFEQPGANGFFWTNTEVTTNNPYAFNLIYDHADMSGYFYNIKSGVSVRCIKD